MGKVGLYPEHGYKRYGNVVKSKQQLELLRTIFEIDPKPHRYVIYDICHKTGLYYQECLDWFRYQRMKAKRQKNNNDTSHERPIEQATRLATPPVDWAVAFAEKCSSTNDVDSAFDTLVDKLSVKDCNRLQKKIMERKCRMHKPSDDEGLSRETMTLRSEQCWLYMESVFGASSESPLTLNQDGYIMLDGAMMSGLEAMFGRHRDYLLALAHRFEYTAGECTKE